MGQGDHEVMCRWMSADYCRMRGIEGVGIVELVYVGGLLRMGVGDSLLLPVWRSVGGGFTGKGESDVWVVCSRLNLGVQGENLTCWLTWVAAWLVVQCVWELVLFYGMGVEFKGEIFSNYYSRRVKWQQGVTAGTDLVCMFWSDHFILSHWCAQWWLPRQGGSAVVGDHCPEWECKVRLFSCDVVNILLKTNGRRGGRDRNSNFVGGVGRQRQKV